MMNYFDGVLIGAHVRHGARKPKGRFDRSWSVGEEAWLAREEASDWLDQHSRQYERWMRDDEDYEPPLDCCWWLLIANRAGRNHFGCPPSPTICSGVRGDLRESPLQDCRERSVSLDHLLHCLKTPSSQWLNDRTKDSAQVSLARHPFFLAGPDIGFETPAAEILENIVVYRRFWLREVAEWTPPPGDAAASLADLFSYLFARYDLPGWLAARIDPTRATTSNGWMPLALWVAQGGSVYHGLYQIYRSSGGEPTLTRRGVQLLRDAPAESEIEEAIYYALILQSGGDATAVWDFRHCRCPSPSVGAPVVRAVAPWLAKNRAKLAPTLGMLIVAWALCEADQRENNAKQNGSAPRPLCLKRRSVRSVIKEVFEALSDPEHPLPQRYYQCSPWPSQGWNRCLSLDGVTWTIREIVTLKELAQESHEMNHCVFQYWAQCASGETMIFSLKSDRGDRVTLQICPWTHILLQVRGHTNRPPTPAEAEAAQRWLRDIHAGWREPGVPKADSYLSESNLALL